MDAEIAFVAISALAAAVSSVAALMNVRHSSAERQRRDCGELVRDRRHALAALGDAILELAALSETASAPATRHGYAVAKMRAEYALNFTLHPGIEYMRIARVIEEPPENLTAHDFEDALHAVFQSSEAVADALP